MAFGCELSTIVLTIYLQITMILLAESGSTKTDWRLLSGSITEIAVKTDGINPYFQGKDQIVRLLKEQLEPNLVVNAITEIYYYGTGITDDSKRHIVSGALRKVFTNAKEIIIESDVVAAARGLFGASAGIACILGTGSNSCFYDGEKITFQVPPLGFWLGDEGSGGYLGKQLVLSYLHKEMGAEVRQLFEAKHGVFDRMPVIENAYQKPNPNRYFASFSPFLLENKEQPEIEELIRNSFRLFFEKYLLKYPDIEKTPVGFVGSIAHYYRSFLEAEAAVHGIKIKQILKAPMDGLITYHKG
ncbi:MAG: glucosamine kinase [Spirosomataceae bacterium]|jgi:N-acetylglucosamine kinase-like BadF-type ATPase